MVFFGTNVRVARIFRELTQEALAEKVAVSEATIWQMERGRQPSDSVVKAVALVLGFEPEFFFQPLEEEFTENDCHFRRNLTATERIRKRVLARGTLFAHLVRHLQAKVVLPKYNIPSIPSTSGEDLEIEAIAAECRRHFRLGDDGPISHMGRVLENAGVMVTVLSGDFARVDAFSRRSKSGALSFVVLSATKGSSSRSRFDMAHELGHLVMHDDRAALTHKKREEQADKFAAAFLLPRKGFSREFWSGGHLDWMRVFELKARWKTSAQAMIYRGFELGLIDAVEFRRAYKTFSARGWRRGEPEEPPIEQPELFRTALSTLRERKGIGIPALAHELYWTPKTFADVTGVETASPAPLSDKHLTLVKSERRRKVSGT